MDIYLISRAANGIQEKAGCRLWLDTCLLLPSQYGSPGVSGGRGQGGLQPFTPGESYPQPLTIGNELDGAVLTCMMLINYRQGAG